MSMDLANFKEYVKTRKALNTEDIHTTLTFSL